MSGQPNPTVQEQKLAYLILTMGTFLLALNHVIGRGVHEFMPPLGLSFWRWFVAGFFLLPFALHGIRSTLTVYRQHWRSYLLLGGLVAGPTSLMLVALNFTTATNVTLINATQPTLTVLFSWLFFGVRIRQVQVVGIIAAFVGVLTMISRGSWQTLASLDFNIGDLLALVAMLGLAAYPVWYARLRHNLTLVRAYLPIVFAGSALILPFYIAESVFLRPVPTTATSIGVILTVALLVTIGAMLMLNTGIKLVGANKSSMFINLVPVFGAFLAVTVLGEHLELYHLTGMMLIGLGVWLVLRV